MSDGYYCIEQHIVKSKLRDDLVLAKISFTARADFGKRLAADWNVASLGVRWMALNIRLCDPGALTRVSRKGREFEVQNGEKFENLRFTD